jgi:hypothetical protein
VHVLLSEPDTWKYYDTYTDFLISTFRFQVYCTSQLDNRIEDYSFIETSLFRGPMNRMKEMAQNSKLEGCENLVREFLYCHENNFRNGYLNACAQRAFKEAYSNDLAFVLLDPLVKGMTERSSRRSNV